MSVSKIERVGALRVRRLAPLCPLLLAAAATASAADRAGGSIVLGKHTASVQHAVLVRGPDEMRDGKTLLRLYLSSADIAAAIKACKTLSCADAALTDGAAVDFSDASHLGYWVALNGGRAQYSGGTSQDAFKLSANTADHLAGKLHIDDAAMGGAKVDADFDASLASTFTKVR